MASIKKAGPWNPQKATAYVGKGVLKNGGGITPVPNGHLIKKDGTSLKNGGKVKISAGGEKHVIYKKTSPTGLGKGKKGDIMVNHPTTDKGKWDTIDLTKKAKAKTVAQGVAATKKLHKENPNYGNSKKPSVAKKRR
jgi:hypothetical protein